MLWRVRTTLDDRPGALAELARACGEAGVNILGVQIFPDLEQVTDELVVRTPDDFGRLDLIALLEPQAGRGVVVQQCTEAALTDQPTRYVEAARTVLARPSSFPDVVARLLDAEADPGILGALQDSMEMTVGAVQVQIRRSAPFTPTERARGQAMAGLVSDVLQRAEETDVIAGNTGRRLGQGLSPEYVADGTGVSAVLGELVVGQAALTGEVEPGVRSVTLRVDAAFRRRGIGTRLLTEICRLAAGTGATDILLTTGSGNQAVLPMVIAAGMRGRIRMSGDRLTVRVSVGALRALGDVPPR